MINVHKNPNLQGWFNVVFNGELIDNAKSFAKAMRIAKRLSRKTQAPIISSK